MPSASQWLKQEKHSEGLYSMTEASGSYFNEHFIAFRLWNGNILNLILAVYAVTLPISLGLSGMSQEMKASRFPELCHASSFHRLG